MSEAVWLVILGIITVVVKEWADSRRFKRNLDAIKGVKSDVKVVKEQTDGMTSQLIQSLADNAAVCGFVAHQNLQNKRDNPPDHSCKS